jgi:hypothetical protein
VRIDELELKVTMKLDDEVKHTEDRRLAIIGDLMVPL